MPNKLGPPCQAHTEIQACRYGPVPDGVKPYTCLQDENGGYNGRIQALGATLSTATHEAYGTYWELIHLGTISYFGVELKVHRVAGTHSSDYKCMQAAQGVNVPIISHHMTSHTHGSRDGKDL